MFILILKLISCGHTVCILNRLLYLTNKYGLVKNRELDKEKRISALPMKRGVLVYATSVRGGRNQFEHLTIIHEVAVHRDPGAYILSRAGRLHQSLSPHFGKAFS